MAAGTTPAAAAPTTAAATMAATAASARDLHGGTKILPIEEIERGETDVGHFLFAKDEALVGRVVVGLRELAVGTVDADALPASENPSPAAPSAVTAAALVVRFRFEACLTFGMPASSVRLL